MKREDTNKPAVRFLVCTMALATATLVASATPASAETTCPEPSNEGAPVSICGRVFDDANSDKVQGDNEPYVGGMDATVVAEETTTHATYTADTSACDEMYPESCGFFSFLSLPKGKYDICVIKDGAQATCLGAAEVQTVPVTEASGVTEPGAAQDIGRPGITGEDDGPGTGTPGYWKNHPEAWPVDVVTIGKVPYAKDVAIKLMGKVGGDKSITIFSSLLSAKLNVMIHNPATCVAQAISDGDAWFVTYEPTGIPGTKIGGSSIAWAGDGNGDAIHQVLDNYNNGLLGPGCGHHRD